MTSLRLNLIANFVGFGWVALLQFTSVPILIKALGVEGYGLIGFFMILQMTLQVLDLGLSTTINRELARYAATSDQTHEMSDFLRTLETVYWLIGLAIGGILYSFAPLIASTWLKADAPQLSATAHSVQLIALVVAIQWPLSFYQGGLIGLQRLLLLNALRIACSTFTVVGALVVVTYWYPSPDGYFSWYAMGSGVQVILSAAVLWHVMPKITRHAHVKLELLRRRVPFVTGMSGLLALGILLSQMDRIALSWRGDLKELGYYATAGMVAGSLQLFITPIYSAVFPRMSGLVKLERLDNLSELYHAGTQLMAVCILPTTVVIGMYSEVCINLWISDREVARNTSLIAQLLLAGTALNGLMHLPYGLQLANGWTRLGLVLGVVELIIFTPLFFWSASVYGGIGVASGWVVFNCFHLVAGVPLTHRRLLSGHARKWFLEDLLPPLVVSIFITAVSYRLVTFDDNSLMTISKLALIASIVFAGSAMSVPSTRSVLFGQFSRRSIFS